MDGEPVDLIFLLLAPEDAGADHLKALARLSRLMREPKLMAQLGVSNGYRVLINTGPDGKQEVYHLHMHVMGGPRPWTKG